MTIVVAIRRMLDRLRPRAFSAMLDALAVVAPVDCAGCGRGDRSLCAGCRDRLTPTPCRVHAGRSPPVVWAGLEYAGTARQVVLAYKDGGRTDVAPALARVLRETVAAALADHPATAVEIVAVPSTRAAMRRRGYRPVDLLVSRAGLRPARVLRAARRTRDQAGLGRARRRLNREGSLQARRGLDGRRFLIVDDIVTTGSTLREVSRAIESAGGEVVAAATVAFTRRLLPDVRDAGSATNVEDAA